MILQRREVAPPPAGVFPDTQTVPRSVLFIVYSRHDDDEHGDYNEEDKREQDWAEHPEPRPVNHLTDLEGNKKQCQCFSKADARVPYFRMLHLRPSYRSPRRSARHNPGGRVLFWFILPANKKT